MQNNIRYFSSFKELPPTYDALFQSGAAKSFCLTKGWFETLANHTLRNDARLRILSLETDDSTTSELALLAGVGRSNDPLAYGGRSFTGLHNFYSMLYAPLVSPTTSPEFAIPPLIADLSARRPSYDVLSFQALDPDSSSFSILEAAARKAGFKTQTYFHFGNPYEPITGINSTEYFQNLPTKLQHTIRRKTAHLTNNHDVRITISQHTDELHDAMKRYEAIYAASWKKTEPFPSFIRELVEKLASAGALRLGLLSIDGRPIAAQIWIVWRSVATVYKLAHDSEKDGLSPGTVLTMEMIRHLIDTDNVRELDFGPGDDAYKSAWTTKRRERWGILAFNPKTIRGNIGIVRHILGRRLKRVLVRGA